MESMDKFAAKLLEYLNSTEIFLKEQTPDFVNQFIAYATYEAYFKFYVALAFLILFAVAQLALFLCTPKDQRGDEGFAMGAFFIGALGSVALFITCHKYMDIKKLEIAPKVYMIEQATKMISGRK